MAERVDLGALLDEGGVAACCAALYTSPAVRWFLGGELHPGGEAATRRSLELSELREGERLLDVGSGPGVSAMLAAREFGSVVAGLEFGPDTVREAQASADAAGLCDRVGFIVGDASALPFADGEFDAVLCECSLSTFPDKDAALGEIRRVLRPGGRAAISDVVVDRRRLPDALSGTVATLACVGGALSRDGYEELLARRDLDAFAVEPLTAEADRLAGRLEDRLRLGRILDKCRANPEVRPFGFDEAIAAVRLARRAISDGALGYAIFAAAAR
ncbi:MAG: methyltransferase domain-containing protein [Solirubrobacterales bacterium]